jgi:hypothetical protein
MRIESIDSVWEKPFAVSLCKLLTNWRVIHYSRTVFCLRCDATLQCSMQHAACTSTSTSTIHIIIALENPVFVYMKRSERLYFLWYILIMKNICSRLFSWWTVEDNNSWSSKRCAGWPGSGLFLTEVMSNLYATFAVLLFNFAPFLHICKQLLHRVAIILHFLTGY